MKGTAVGKKFTLAYANIFMAAWEKQVLRTVPQKPAHYFRYLDDIWGVWIHSGEEFQTFVHKLNNFNTPITVKVDIHTDLVNFLDTTNFKGLDF